MPDRIAFDFNNPVCPRNLPTCYQQTLYADGHFECICGFRAYKKVENATIEPEEMKDIRYKLPLTEILKCECGRFYRATHIAKRRGRKYCPKCLGKIRSNNMKKLREQGKTKYPAKKKVA